MVNNREKIVRGLRRRRTMVWNSKGPGNAGTFEASFPKPLT